jgi:hypothetical protein
VDAKRAEGRRWDEGQRTYRDHLETRTRTLHPFRIAAAALQTSAQGDRPGPAVVAAIEAWAEHAQLPDRHTARHQVRKQ